MGRNLGGKTCRKAALKINQMSNNGQKAATFGENNSYKF